MNIVASIQARLGSSRLPGKVLKDICGKPMLQWQIERLHRSSLVDSVLVATTTKSTDDPIADLCNNLGIDCYRGSEDDVLGRISGLVREYGVDLHVECYGDSPLIDPQIVDEFIGNFLKYRDSYDYLSSALQTTYPPGLEVTVYQGSVLLEVDALLSKNDPLREHVGYNITRFPETYRLRSMIAPPWFNYPDTYMEVDTTEDLEVMRAIFKYFVAMGQSHFSLSQILDMSRKHPEVFNLNAFVERRWKALREHSDV